MFACKKIMKFYAKSSIWTKLILWIFVVFIIARLMRKYTTVKEGFIQKETFILKEGPDIFDDFYVSIYDDLVFSQVKNKFEIGEIINTTKATEESRLLDIGTGAGHHVNLFTQEGINAKGLDISPAMVARAKKLYPNSEFIQGDALDFMLFPDQSFTHISALYFTIYYIKDKLRFFQNCFDWLMPGGYMILHLVNRNKFDPIVEAADPLLLVSPQKFSKKRITNSLVKFKDFQYKADFDLKIDENEAIFTETFKDDISKNVRQFLHKLYMEPQKNILSLAKEVGFILLGKIDMVSVQYEYQYIYILEKSQ